MKLEKLLKEYSLNSDMSYFDMILQSVESGQRKQAATQFLQLAKIDRKNFIKYVATAFDKMPLPQQRFNEFVDLL